MTTARDELGKKPMLPNTTNDSTPLAFGSTVGLGPLPARWYCVSNDGMATLCKDQEDAQANARHCDLAWPKGAPHRAVMLGDVSAERQQWLDLLRECEQSLSDMTGPYWPARVAVLRRVQAALRA